MDNNAYTSMVDVGKYPDDVIVPLDKPFTDERGIIQNLVLKPMNSTAVITSKAGSIRAQHYHKTDWHYTILISGSIEYYHRPVGSLDPPKRVMIQPMEVFFTPPMVEHAMVFLEDSVIITMAKNVRTHDNHESDVVRVKLV